jgi:hypothetical protein
MANAKLEVCACCAMKEPYIAEAVNRLKAEYRDKLDVLPRKCLDICQDFGAVKLGDEVMTLRQEDMPAFEARVRQAAESAQ